MCNVSRSNLRTFLKVLPSLNPCDNPSFATNPISKFGFLTIVFCCCKNCKISNILSKIILLRHSGNVEALLLQSFGTFESQQNKMQNYPFKSHLWGLFPSPPPHSFEAEQKMLQKNFLRISIRAATTQTAVLLIVMNFLSDHCNLVFFFDKRWETAKCRRTVQTMPTMWPRTARLFVQKLKHLHQWKFAKKNKQLP